jgi:YrbI family 3-deoxy-D-manno-octulosonate 8-phosphate phosphatase
VIYTSVPELDRFALQLTIRLRLPMDFVKPKALIFDFDGVLTDNKVYVTEDGKEMVRCNRSDGLAFDAFRKLGLPVFLVSRETNPVVGARAAKLKVPVLQAVTDKPEAVSALAQKQGLSMSEILFVGNDLNDLDVMTACGLSACPSDSHPRICAAATFVLQTRGGEGVAREVAEKILGIDIAMALRTQKDRNS